jgi:hypothetical protein
MGTAISASQRLAAALPERAAGVEQAPVRGRCLLDPRVKPEDDGGEL